ncbi:MAG: trypsin-like peptidase domain-containing protein, partial [Spirochaetaceae bacterium]
MASRRYSQSQLVFVGTAGVVLAVLLAIGFGLPDIPGGGRGAEEQEKAEREPQGGASGAGREEETSLEAITAENRPGSPGVSGDGGSERERRTMRVYEQRNASVVNINTETVSYNWFLDPVPREGDSGSGSIVDHRGYVLTNHHLVNEAVSVYVMTADEWRQEAKVVGVDPENDLAVLKFDPGDRELSAIPFG